MNTPDMNDAWRSDPDFLGFKDVAIEVLQHGGEPRLIDEAARPYTQASDHPVVKLAKAAMADGKTDRAKTNMITRLLHETGNSKTAPLMYCVDLFDAVVQNDPIGERIALKELARGTKRKEWEEAV